ncbi:Uncharacterized protein GBIM_20649 [Gryllus bimaculatus]|nr:Uncharacterized protein GBIM_20649 [Gryllus bimaculatus]
MIFAQHTHLVHILTISSDLETVLQVVNDIIPNVEDASTRTGSRSDDVELRLLVHQSQAGCIIGKSGVKIQKLREKTGARIKIFSNCCPQSTDRVCQISGRPNTCIESIKEIVELIKTSPMKGMNSPYDPHNYDDYYAQEYGGYGDQESKARGGPMRGGMGPPPMGGRGGGRFGGLGGNMGPGGPPPRGGPRGGMGGPPPPPGGMGPGAPGPRGVGNFGANRGGFGGAANGMMNSNAMNMGNNNNGGQNPMLGGKNTTQVTIPKDLAGAIIGKGGARIRKIRSDSGAGITIDEPLAGSTDRIITITGTPNQIQMAQYLLQQSHNNTTVHLVSFVRVSLNGCAISSTYFHLLEEQKDLWNCEITKTCVPEDTTLLHTQLQYFLAHSNLKTVLIQGNQFSTNGFANNNVSMEHLIDYTYFNAGFYLIVFDLCFLQSLNFIT